MAPKACITITIILVSILITSAEDPDITSDFIAPENNPPKFIFRGLREAIKGTPTKAPLTVKRASQVEFPALQGLGVSYASLQFKPNSINGPHTHPRASEILLVLQGSLEVGFVDSGNKLFGAVLEKGDMFVFPKGLVHYQVNRDKENGALAIAAFGSVSPGTVVMKKAVFESGIDKDLLAVAFGSDVQTIEKLG